MRLADASTPAEAVGVLLGGNARIGASRLASHIGSAAAMIAEACVLTPTRDDLAAMAGIARQLCRDAERLESSLRQCRTLLFSQEKLR